jgi:hypothetical protein
VALILFHHRHRTRPTTNDTAPADSVTANTAAHAAIDITP